MKASSYIFISVLFVAIMLNCMVGIGQTHLPPVALNDSATIIQPYADTINVTANDTSPSGDNFCLRKVYGSPFFHALNCNNVVFNSDSSLFGNDTAWYVICNVNQPSLCDTAEVVVNVQRHYTPMMLNNSRWINYTESDCDNAGFESWDYYWTTADTLINGQVYRILYTNSVLVIYNCQVNGEPDPPQVFQTKYAGFLRQDTFGHKVYVLLPGSTNEQLLYDFDLPIGDTAYSVPYDTQIISSVNYYKSNESYYRRMQIMPLGINSNGGESDWIEGIGSIGGPVNAFRQAYSALLICFSTNGQTIYPNYANDTCAYISVGITTIPLIQSSVHPNPTTGFCTLQLAEGGENFSASVYDITGREILPLFTNQSGSIFNFNVSALADGLYFVKIHNNKGQVGISKLVKE
jgi:hypothetical protein